MIWAVPHSRAHTEKHACTISFIHHCFGKSFNLPVKLDWMPNISHLSKDFTYFIPTNLLQRIITWYHCCWTKASLILFMWGCDRLFVCEDGICHTGCRSSSCFLHTNAELLLKTFLTIITGSRHFFFYFQKPKYTMPLNTHRNRSVYSSVNSWSSRKEGKKLWE